MRNDRFARPIRTRGFTLFELIVTIVIVAVLAAIALPNFGSSLRNNRVTTETNDLLSAINMARNEAVTRAAPVSVCPSSDGATCAADATAWAQGWMVFVDYGNPGEVNAGDGDTVLRVWQKIDSRDSIVTTSPYLRYTTTGTVADGSSGFTETKFWVKAGDCTADQKRRIDVMALGRAESQRVECSYTD